MMEQLKSAFGWLLVGLVFTGGYKGIEWFASFGTAGPVIAMFLECVTPLFGGMIIVSAGWAVWSLLVSIPSVRIWHEKSVNDVATRDAKRMIGRDE